MKLTTYRKYQLARIHHLRRSQLPLGAGRLLLLPRNKRPGAGRYQSPIRSGRIHRGGCYHRWPDGASASTRRGSGYGSEAGNVYDRECSLDACPSNQYATPVYKDSIIKQWLSKFASQFAFLNDTFTDPKSVISNEPALTFYRPHIVVFDPSEYPSVEQSRLSCPDGHTATTSSDDVELGSEIHAIPPSQWCRWARSCEGLSLENTKRILRRRRRYW